jgi:hypothetical protein
VRTRRDGWTIERQLSFIRLLQAHRCVAEACRLVGISANRAYRLYGRPDAESFRRAWDAALSGFAPTAPAFHSSRATGSERSSPSRGQIDAAERQVRQVHHLPEHGRDLHGQPRAGGGSGD